MELALGTVQFGMKYGISGRGTVVPHEETRVILRHAHELGVGVLDTAASYGDIEERLRELSQGLDFRVVSKLPRKPESVVGASATALWAEQQVRRSHQHLGTSLSELLFHQADDLLAPDADFLWRGASEACASLGIKGMGVSVYDPEALELLCARFPITLAQLPGNAFDQRVSQVTFGAGSHARPALHLRSAFLQGLLLMPDEDVAARLPAALFAVRSWRRWCDEWNLPPLQAALSIVKGFDGVTHCIVGVDSVVQLTQIVEAWQLAKPIKAPELALEDANIIDPRFWRSAL